MTTRVGEGQELRTRLRDAERQARRYRAALDNVVDAIVIIDGEGRLTFANEAAHAMLGVGTPRYGDDALSVIHPEDLEQTVADLSQLVNQPGSDTCVQFRVQTRGGWLWVEATARNRLDDPDVGGVVVSFRDLTHVRALERLARHDALTGLTNRTTLHETLRVALARQAGGPRGHDHRVAVLFIDLDRFKLVNDSLGHGVGDELLIQVAARLQRIVPEAVTIARFGGDEFVIVLDDLAEPGQAEAVARRVLEGLAAPFVGPRSKLHLDASIGIAVADDEVARPDDLLANADAALYAAKGRRGSWQNFTPQLREVLRGRLELEADLRRALDTGEFVVHYQPIVDLRSGATVELEALVRWAHPQLGLLAPSHFLSLADDTGLIEGIGEVVLATVATDLNRLATTDWRDVGIAVNLAPRQLVSDAVVASFEAAAAASGGPGRLTAEITEHALVGDLTRVLATVNELRRGGVRVAIDDFGIGHTSLGHLAEVPIDSVKLDQSFVGPLGSSQRSRGLVASIISLIHALDLPVVGEGVETAEQHRVLEELGCDRVQGYLLGRPAALDDLIASAAPGDTA